MFKISYDKIIFYLFFLLFIISFVFYQYATPIVFYIAIFIVLLEIISGKLAIYLDSISTVYFSILIIIGLYSALLGLILGNDYTAIFSQFKIYFIYSFIALFLVHSWTRILSEDRVKNIIIFTISCIILLNLGAMADYFYQIRLYSESFKMNNHLIFSSYNNIFKLGSLNSFVLCVFLPLCYFFKRIANSYYINIVFLLSIFLLLIGGRAAFIVLTITFGLVQIAISRTKNFGDLLIFFYLGLAIPLLAMVLAYFYMDLGLTVAESVESVRIYQWNLFISEFLSAPFGQGFGSVFLDSRSGLFESVFELAKLKLLVDGGVVVLVSAVVLVLFFFQSFYLLIIDSSGKKGRAQSFAKYAFFSFAFSWVASLSNPYDENLDGVILAIFLLGIIDSYLRFWRVTEVRC